MRRVIIHTRLILDRHRMMGAGIKANSDNERNIQYAYGAIADSVKRGEDPIAFQLLHQGAGNSYGSDSGRSWWQAADMHAFYTDRNWDDYMLEAEDVCLKHGYPHELRSLNSIPILSTLARYDRVRPID